jgi:hypothetical protein
MLAMRQRERARLLLTAAGVAAAAWVAGGCAGPASTGSAAAGAKTAMLSGSAAPTAHGRSPAPSATVSPATSTWPTVVPVVPAAPGQHQTRVRPPAQSPEFRAEMTDLWAGVVSGRPALAMPAFFPLVAYEQVKAIADPAADWQHRLVAEFRADVVAAHALIGQRARHATLVTVIVPELQADWINPGVCDNSVGYWHAANARLVYQVNGRRMSFGIATLISWRGRWYVVHLGGEVRTTSGGMVDQPAAGPGVPGPPGGC